VAFALASVGVVLTLGLDQVSMFLIQRANRLKTHDSQQGDSLLSGHSNRNIETESQRSIDQHQLQQIPTSQETCHKKSDVDKYQKFQLGRDQEKPTELHVIDSSFLYGSIDANTHSHSHNMLMISDHVCIVINNSCITVCASCILFMILII
jgi:hypothetical protein